MTDRPRPTFALRPRALVLSMLAVVLIVAAAVAISLVLESRHPGRVELSELSEDSTATVGFAGVFPAEEDAPLSNPLGIAFDGEQLYVAESDAGRIQILDLEGGRVGTIVLPVESGIASAYPSVVAMAGDKLAIIDNASNRVLVVAAQPADVAKEVVTLGKGDDAPRQPTAVAYAGEEYFVADAFDGFIKVYDDGGAYLRTLGEDLEPALGIVGGLTLANARLVVADSNAGRIVVLDPEDGAQIVVFPERYALPRAVAPIGDGAIAVVDTFARAAVLTTAEGARLTAVDESSVGGDAPSSPRGAAWVPATSRLYVTDAGGGRVRVYNIRPSVIAGK